MDEKIKLFEPTAQDMKLEYPELVEYKEFKGLSARELKLCWYVGNRTSPIANYRKEQRYKKALSMAYGKIGAKRKDVQDMLNGNIPDNILKGIKRMATFNPSVRLRAKFATEYIFDRLNELIEISEQDMKAMDFDDRKKYTELIIKISAEMPDMIKRMEGGYGIKVEVKKKTAEVKASISELN